MNNQALYERIKNLQTAIDLEIALAIKENGMTAPEAKGLVEFLSTMAQSNIDNGRKIFDNFLA